MCGLCGIAASGQGAEADHLSRIAHMVRTLVHRGPDEGGVAARGRVTLGHRRLSIVDLAHGQQPMTNEDGTIWVVFNGEIYNHAEFRAELTAKGHTYRTRCDTEAILHLYEEEGEKCVERLHGMFAFAVWDERRQLLLLARDRTGIKPLYYAATAADDLVFGSEVKALFASGLLTPALNEDAVAEYFATGHVSGKRTLFKGICKLEPGSVLVWQQGILRTHRYWRPGNGLSGMPAEAPPTTLAEAADTFSMHFKAAVRSQLMSDVPLGIFLSGGVDSSLIAAAMCQIGTGELQTFSVGYREASASELPYARLVSNQLGTKHHEVVIGATDFFEQLPRLTWQRDLPLTFSASIPLYFVSRLASEHVKVVLTGEGSDELFAGYGRHLRGMWNYRLSRLLDRLLPGPLRRASLDFARRGGESYLGSRLRRSFLGHSGTVEEAYLEAFADFDAGDRRSLLGRGDAATAYGDLAALIDVELLRRNPLEVLLRYDQATYLEELLMKQDAMSMATSIESRVPFLHDPLLVWAAALPPSVKLNGRVGKALVRLAAAAYLPPAVTDGAKRGFPVPLGEWLRGVGRPVLEAYLPDLQDSLLQGAYARRLLAAHLSGVDHTARLWRLLAFQIWRRETLPSFSRLAAGPAPLIFEPACSKA